MLDFSIVHKRNKSLDFKNYFLNSKTLFWETCLRQVVFSKEVLKNSSEIQSSWRDLEFFEGKRAYQFLLEVISGLHSPILGETEVLGQFKIWVRENKGSEFDTLWQRLLMDAKKVRSIYLNGIHQQSYGSLVRKVTKPYSSIKMIGAGFLVKKILPWLNKGKEIVLFCRDLKKGHTLKNDFSHLTIEVRDLFDLDQNQSSVQNQNQNQGQNQIQNSVLIIAAPLSLKELRPWAEKKEAGLILDLRAQSDLEKQYLKLKPPVSFKTLNEMLKEGELQNKVSEHKIHQAFQMIQKKSDLFSQNEKVFPFGWEDLSF